MDDILLRDYFAAHAPAYPFELPKIYPGMDEDPARKVVDAIAAWGYAYADAMMAKRASPND